MADHVMCSFLTRTFLFVRDADKCPVHGPKFFVVVTVIAARRAYRVVVMYYTLAHFCEIECVHYFLLTLVI